jgi:hypothetical protein
VAGLLRRVNFNSLADRSGITGFVAGMGIETDASGFIALIAKSPSMRWGFRRCRTC